jgi:hypothetical protein
MKMILPLRTPDNRFGKSSLNKEGPYKVIGIAPGNAYFVETLEGRKMVKVLNVKYLKKYFLSVVGELVVYRE